jgi:LysM repeat protein
MKFERIPTRRTPVKTRLYARLFNKTQKPRKQRASAAASSADEVEGPGINISRSLSIIFAIHILAIGMIFIHKQYLSGRTQAPAESSVSSNESKTKPVVLGDADRPVLSSGKQPYMVKKGDNYAIIAAKFQVEQSELRNMNPDVDIRAGAILLVPQSRRIVAEDPPELTAIRDRRSVNESESGLVEILPPIGSAQAQLVRPTINQFADAPRAIPVSSSRTHTVKSGENIWRISNQYRVSQNELLKINNITDPTKLRIGQILKLP